MPEKSPRFDMYVWQVVPWAAVRDDVLYLEAAGTSTVWIGDSFVMPPVYGDFILEAWATLSALAACTTRVGGLVSVWGQAKTSPRRRPRWVSRRYLPAHASTGCVRLLILSTRFFEIRR